MRYFVEIELMGGGEIKYYEKSRKSLENFTDDVWHKFTDLRFDNNIEKITINEEF